MKRIIVLLAVLLCFAGCASQSNLTREERRENFRQHIDSLVMSGDFIFRPNSFRIQPAGRTRQITNPNYRVMVTNDFIDINLPFMQGIVPPYRMVTLRSVVPFVSDYTAVRMPNGEWTITFSTNAAGLGGGSGFTFRFTVNASSGFTQLNISSIRSSVNTYNGSILPRF